MFFYRIDKMWRFKQGVESRSDNEDEMTEEEIAALEKKLIKFNYCSIPDSYSYSLGVIKLICRFHLPQSID
jgi:hypothetical protein